MRLTETMIATLYAILLFSSATASKPANAPLLCSRGAKDARFKASVTMPASVAAGTTFTVRIDSVSSGKVSHLGLEYLYDMTTEYQLPEGVTYVDGSARIVAKTGTPNVLTGARVWYADGVIHYLLPAHVANNSSYTPPSIQFELRADSHSNKPLALSLSHYEIKAHAAVVGDVLTTCDPRPSPYTIAVTKVAL